MAQIRWTRSATAALNAMVRNRREQVRFNAARTLHQTITQRAFLLKEFPELGRQMRELPNDDRRELLVSVYRIVYRMEGDTVFIVNIEDARNLFSQNEEGDFLILTCIGDLPLPGSDVHATLRP